MPGMLNLSLGLQPLHLKHCNHQKGTYGVPYAKSWSWWSSDQGRTTGLGFLHAETTTLLATFSENSAIARHFSRMRTGGTGAENKNKRSSYVNCQRISLISSSRIIA